EKVTCDDLLPVSIQELLPMLPCGFVQARARCHSVSRYSQSCCERANDPNWSRLPVSVDNPIHDSLLPSGSQYPRLHHACDGAQAFETSVHRIFEQSIFCARPTMFRA